MIHTADLQDISRPVKEHLKHLTPGEMLAYYARVSAPQNQDKHETGWKLLESLIKRAEWSPFDMQSVTMEIVTTRDIGRQIIRHRSFTFQEFSQRYANPIDKLGFEYRRARLQDTKDRQNSIFLHGAEHARLQAVWNDLQEQAINTAERVYDTALKLGIAREVARAVLPEGLTVTRMYMHGKVRDWMFYLRLRSMPQTQYEHRLIAESGKTQLLEHFPDLAGFFEGES